MYYISPTSYALELSAVKKRLSDFKGEEGAEYHVRKSPKRETGFFTVPVYVFKNGKLNRTGSFSTFWNDE